MVDLIEFRMNHVITVWYLVRFVQIINSMIPGKVCTVGHDSIQILQPCLFCEHHRALSEYVCQSVEHDTVWHLVVPACSPTLLVQVLHRLTNRVVDHKPHIWFIYTHTKRCGGYHNLQQIIQQITNCTSGLSIPIPNAVVATTTCNKKYYGLQTAHLVYLYPYRTQWWLPQLATKIQQITNRTSGLSIPIPNAVVATTTCNKLDVSSTPRMPPHSAKVLKPCLIFSNFKKDSCQKS
jgi:hypothetical protein